MLSPCLIAAPNERKSIIYAFAAACMEASGASDGRVGNMQIRERQEMCQSETHAESSGESRARLIMLLDSTMQSCWEIRSVW